MEQSFSSFTQKVFYLLKTKKFWVELFIMTLGMGVAAFGVHFFLVPSKLIVGSITGLSIVLSTVTHLPLSALTFIINTFLLVAAFILIGKEFGAKTVYTALVLSPWLWVMEHFFPQEQLFPGGGSVMNDSWFDLLCFVLILSIVQSILFKINASTGGLDIIAKIINKYLHVDLGTSVTIGGGLICCTAFYINPPNLVIIGLLGTWLNGLVITYFSNGFNMRKRVQIVTPEYERVRDFILFDIVRGVTLYEIRGGYSGKPMLQIEAVLTNDEFARLMTYVNNQQIKAFTTVDIVTEVHGLWVNKRKKTMQHGAPPAAVEAALVGEHSPQRATAAVGATDEAQLSDETAQ